MSNADRVAVVSRAERGIDAPEVVIETQVSGGLPGFAVVGLPETAVREARERVKGAIASGRCKFPKGQITVNLAPADLLKEGGRLDLGIAARRNFARAPRRVVSRRAAGVRPPCAGIAAPTAGIRSDRVVACPRADSLPFS
jgi:hypothetical protein